MKNTRKIVDIKLSYNINNEKKKVKTKTKENALFKLASGIPC